MKISSREMVFCALAVAVVLPLVSSQSCTPQDDVTLKHNCISPRSSDGAVCSGRGRCECGLCRCDTRTITTLQRYSGQYCECDDYTCPALDGKLCGGHGVCACGLCSCYDGRKGKACECSTSNTACLASNGKVCNGSGNCVCGACKCSSWSGFYGPTCEDCPTCNHRCSDFRDCALCKGFKSGPITGEDCSKERCRNVEVVDSVEMDQEKAKQLKMSLCEFIDEADDCTVRFSYTYTDNNRALGKVQNTKECPEKSPSSSGTRHSQRELSITLITLCSVILYRVR